MNDFKLSILTILDIVGFAGDKEIFSSNFIDVCTQETIIKLVNQLPTDQQKQINIELTEMANPEKALSIINKYFPTTNYSSCFIETFEANISSYLQIISPSLSPTQLKNLKSAFPQ